MTLTIVAKIIIGITTTSIFQIMMRELTKVRIIITVTNKAEIFSKGNQSIETVIVMTITIVAKASVNISVITQNE